MNMIYGRGTVFIRNMNFCFLSDSAVIFVIEILFIYFIALVWNEDRSILVLIVRTQ